MKLETSRSASADQPRCKHFTANGRRCRLRPLDSGSGLCFRHASLQNAKSDAIDLTSAFGDSLTDFKSAVQINEFLAKLALLLVQNRISCRRAAVLAFISNLTLRTLPAIDFELNGDQDQIPRISFDLPCHNASSTDTSDTLRQLGVVTPVRTSS